jgi:hypothetical protein
MEDVLGRAAFHRVFDHMLALAGVMNEEVRVVECTAEFIPSMNKRYLQPGTAGVPCLPMYVCFMLCAVHDVPCTGRLST